MQQSTVSTYCSPMLLYMITRRVDCVNHNYAQSVTQRNNVSSLLTWLLTWRVARSLRDYYSALLFACKCRHVTTVRRKDSVRLNWKWCHVLKSTCTLRAVMVALLVAPTRRRGKSARPSSGWKKLKRRKQDQYDRHIGITIINTHALRIYMHTGDTQWDTQT